MSHHEVMGYLGEERCRAEEGAAHEVGRDGREDRGEQRVERELAKDDLEPEEEPGDRGVERRGDPARCPAGHDDAQPGLRHPHPLAQRRGGGRPDLDDRALAPHRPADTDADGRGEGLDDAHLGADPPTVLRDGEHDLGHPVTTCLTGEALDERPVDEASEHRDQQEEPDPEPGKMEAADPTLLPELLVAGRQPGESEDQPPKPHGTEARNAPDHERHDDEPEARGP